MTALAYCTVIGKFNDVTVDGSDGGADPDAAPLVGQVTLTCDARDLAGPSTARLLLPSETPPRTITIEPFPVTLDGTGAFSVEVVATGQTGVTVPSVFTYTASFALKTATGAKVRIPSFSFSAPAGATVDLAVVAPAVTENGINYIVGPAGPAGPTGPAGPSGGGGGSALAPTAVKTANYAAAASDLVPVDSTSASPVITLPTAPADKTQVGVKLVIKPGSNTASVACGGSDVINKSGGSTTFTLTLLNQGAVFQYKASTAIWYVISDDLALSQLDARYAPITGIPESAVTNLTADLAAKATKAQAIGYALVFGGI